MSRVRHWVRNPDGVSANKFLRWELSEKVGSVASRLRTVELLAALRKFYVVVKIVRLENGRLSSCRSTRSSHWDCYQVGYILIPLGGDSVEIDAIVTEKLQEVQRELSSRNTLKGS